MATKSEFNKQVKVIRDHLNAAKKHSDSKNRKKLQTEIVAELEAAQNAVTDLKRDSL